MPKPKGHPARGPDGSSAPIVSKRCLFSISSFSFSSFSSTQSSEEFQRMYEPTVGPQTRHTNTRGIRRLLRMAFLTSCLLSLVVCQPGDDDKGGKPRASHAQSFYQRRGNRDRVIVFIHGIFGSPSETWSCSRDISWPHLLEGDPKFDSFDIYVVGYDAPYVGNHMTIDEIVLNLKSRFDVDGIFSGHREVVFVAHSVGGLVVQRFLLTYRDLASKVQFIYFYSTPKSGVQIARLGHLFSANALLEEVLPGDSNDYLLNLESEWRAARFNIHRYCAYEKEPLNGVIVVDRLSATRECESVVPINENHLTIVKPCNRNVDSYIALTNAVATNPTGLLSVQGRVTQADGIPVGGATVSILGGPRSDTRKTGEFVIQDIPPELKVGFPVTFVVSGWIIEDPINGDRGRTYFPDPSAEPIKIRVMKPGDAAFLKGPSIEKMLGQRAYY